MVTDHGLYLALAHTPQERQQVSQALFQERLHTGLLQEIRTTLHQGRI